MNSAPAHVTHRPLLCSGINLFIDLCAATLTQELRIRANSSSMPLKCCVTGCTSNYATGDPTAVYRLPNDQVERSRWISAIPRENIPDTKYTVVCANHWPSNFPTVT